MGGADAGPPVLDGLVADGELGEVVPNHLGLDLNLVEGFPIVHCNLAAYHLWYDDHVAHISLHRRWLLTGWCLPFLYIFSEKRE